MKIGKNFFFGKCFLQVYLFRAGSESIEKGKRAPPPPKGPSSTPANHWQAPLLMLHLNHNNVNLVLT